MEIFASHSAVLIPLLLALGLTSGFMAGMLGIGGGIILVPGLYFIFTTLGFAGENLMHLAVGTSLAIIIPTGLSSAYAHYKKGAVNFDLVRRIGPGIVTGVVAGTFIADMLSGFVLTVIFSAALMVFALLMQIPPKVKHEGEVTIGKARGVFGGLGIGTMSSIMGIGGAVLNVPFMTLNGVPMRNAVASAAAMGPLIALPGTVGYILIGWNADGLPPFSFGYINMLAVLLIAPFSVAMAPFGAAAAHKVSVTALRRVFSVFIVIVAAKMMWDAFQHGG